MATPPATGVLSALPKGQPGLGETIYQTSCLPCAGSFYLYDCRIRAGFPYISRRGLLPMLLPVLWGHTTLVHTLTPNPVRDSHYSPYIHLSTLQILCTTPINVIINNIYSIPAIHFFATIYTYMSVHPLARAPETRLTHYLVARPGATIDGAKYITRSPRRPNIRQRWPDTTTYVPAIPWPSSPTTQKGHNRYTSAGGEPVLIKWSNAKPQTRNVDRDMLIWLDWRTPQTMINTKPLPCEKGTFSQVTVAAW